MGRRDRRGKSASFFILPFLIILSLSLLTGKGRIRPFSQDISIFSRPFFPHSPFPPRPTASVFIISLKKIIFRPLISRVSGNRSCFVNKWPLLAHLHSAAGEQLKMNDEKRLKIRIALDASQLVSATIIPFFPGLNKKQFIFPVFPYSFVIVFFFCLYSVTLGGRVSLATNLNCSSGNEIFICIFPLVKLAIASNLFFSNPAGFRDNIYTLFQIPFV